MRKIKLEKSNGHCDKVLLFRSARNAGVSNEIWKKIIEPHIRKNKTEIFYLKQGDVKWDSDADTLCIDFHLMQKTTVSPSDKEADLNLLSYVPDGIVNECLTGSIKKTNLKSI